MEKNTQFSFFMFEHTLKICSLLFSHVRILSIFFSYILEKDSLFQKMNVTEVKKKPSDFRKH